MAAMEGFLGEAGPTGKSTGRAAFFSLNFSIVSGASFTILPHLFTIPGKRKASLNAELSRKALEKVGNPNVLVNLVSRRVRQLTSSGGAGSRPLVEAAPN